YNTKLVRDAENISSGQKQLIALARTLLSQSEVLLFDEVTSSLDMRTSKQIMKILKDLKRDHTILMITHKPALMKMADEILVIDHGRLVGKGTHKELMENNKYYQILQK
ncbi:MAG: AAA family ATPase, partial [Bacilli bacterium]|nr:AAA family ATPase [Bacilli bacterium]